MSSKLYSSIKAVLSSPAKMSSSSQQKEHDDAAVSVPAIPSMSLTGSGAAVSPPTTSLDDSWVGYGSENPFHEMADEEMERVNQSMSSFTAEAAEHWKAQCRYWKGMAERNQLKAASTSRGPRGGLGKNKQTQWQTDHANVSNKKALHHCTRTSIWSHNKFLHFTGQWTVYKQSAPHPFASHVMKQIKIPPAMRGFESDYYSDFVLPTVSAKLGNLRGNFIKQCGKSFKGKCECTMVG